ncbi:MAG: TIGR00725 family protein [Armatimonadota bacterium]|nr:TIGR00725 family protein [Armatimonadota bacterium]
MSSLVRIGVIGERRASAAMLQAAEEVGREIARRGGILICGGMEGVMEAASRGAAAAGGIVVGILPGSSAASGNEFVTIPIVTGMGEARNVIIARTAEALVAVGGAYGTLSEIAYALQFGVPVIGLQTWELRRPGVEGDPVLRAPTPEAAVDWAWDAAARRRTGAGGARLEEQS